MSTALVQQRWIQQLGSSLDRFKTVQTSRIYNFRCPICMDSQKNKQKSRAYIFFHAKPQLYFFKCHNCSLALSLDAFIKMQYPHQYSEYRMDVFKENNCGTVGLKKVEQIELEPTIEPTVEQPKLSMAVCSAPINTLPLDHPAVMYIKSRKIPERIWSELEYTDNFKDWLLSITDKYANRPMPKDKRIILTLKDKKGKIFGVQARSINPLSKLRYITIKFDDNMPKIFGLDRLNTALPYLIVEGPIDSLFLPNAIAICGGDVSLSLKAIGDKQNAIIIFDNEPRNKDTVHRMERAIEMGFKLAFWPIETTKAKDINDLVLKQGYSTKDILKMFSENVYSGPQAKLKLLTWKKI